MKRTLAALLAVLLIATALPVSAQQDTFYGNNIRPGTSSSGISIGPSSTSGCSVGTNGELSCTQAHTDGYVFLPAYEACNSLNATTPGNRLAATRVASNDWALGHPNGTANAAETINVSCTLNSFLQRVGGSKGVKITSLDLVYQITGVALTSHNLACNATGFPSGCLGGVATAVYANNTANVVGAPLHTNTALSTATQTNPYLTNVPITTAAFLPSNIRTAVTVEWQAVTAVNTVYRIYGVGVNYSVLAE